MDQINFSIADVDAQDLLDKICCLKEEGLRCPRQAGNVTCSYSKNICNFISELKLKIDDLAGHIYICDYHKNMIQSSRLLKPSNCNKAPQVDFSQLQLNTLRRYKKHFNVVTKPGLNKTQISATLLNHFKTIPVNEKEILTYFIHSVKTNSNKLDQQKTGNNSDTM